MKRIFSDSCSGRNERAVAVYENAEWDEFVVKVVENGAHIAEADYFTADRDDAMDTANMMILEGDPPEEEYGFYDDLERI